ncbi:MAG: hypothetical protein ACRC0X_04850, partial [Brevinema sp.]
ELKRYFRPEFLNRIDESIIFNPLGQDSLLEICKNIINDLNTGMKLQGIQFTVSDDAFKYIIEKGFETIYGARSLKRAISKYLEIPATEKVLKSNKPPNTEIEYLNIQVSKSKDEGLDFHLVIKPLVDTKALKKRVRTKKTDKTDVNI